jgi:hypothetical protein
MTDPALIFRTEALRGRTAQPSPGATARTSPRWIAGAYWMLLALLAAGLIAGALIRVTVPQRGAGGATGTASVRVGSQPLIVALVAGLTSDAADG